MRLTYTYTFPIHVYVSHIHVYCLRDNITYRIKFWFETLRTIINKFAGMLPNTKISAPTNNVCRVEVIQSTVVLECL